jgi:hypothetical protein
MRGRRVALLLTGVLPLLAKDDVPATESNVTIDKNDIPAVQRASRALHDDVAIQQLPPLRLLGSANPGNIVMVDPMFDTFGREDLSDQVILKNMSIDLDREIHVTQTEPPEQTSDEHGTAVEETDESIQGRPELSSQDELETDEQDTVIGEADEPEGVTEVSSQDASETHAASETAEDVNTTEDSKSTEHAAQESVLQDNTAKDEEPDRKEQEGDEDEEVVSERVLVDYASKSAGALILEKSPAMKGTSNLLNADTDKYAIAPCAEKKSVVIGLSEDILVKQVKIANYERYSSHLQNFQIMGSQAMENWVDLGTYTASPGLGEQVFELNESSWARYLKFRFLTHYGSEHYCTLSQIKVHGSTMLQGFHEQWEDSQEDMEGEDAATKDSAKAPTEVTDACNGGTIEETDVSSQDGESGVPVDESNVDSQRENNDDTFGTPDETMKTNTDITKEEQSGGASSVESTDEANVSHEEASDASTKADQKPSLGADNSSPQEDILNETSSETKSDNSSDLEVDPRTSVLLSASMKVSSHEAIGSDRTKHTEELGTFAIKQVDRDIKKIVASAVKAVVAVGSEAIMTGKDGRTGVFGSVKELQQKLKTTMEIEEPKERNSPVSTVDIRSNHDDESDDLRSKSDSVETQETDSTAPTVNVRSNQDDASENDGVSKAGTVEVSPAVNASAVTDSVDTPQEKISENSEACIKRSKEAAMPKESAPDARVSKEGEEDVKIRSKEATDSDGKSDGEDLDVVLSRVLARFPSASCIEGLDYHDFKAKIIAARKGGTNAGASHAQGHGGKIEPIFKTLTAEIKALQINQSVQDQYIKALVSCHQRVILEMAETLIDVETRQERRLSSLEDAMEAMRPSSLSRIIAVLTSIASFCVACAGSVSAAVAESVEKLFETDVIDRKAVMLIAGSILTKTTAVFPRIASFCIGCTGSVYSVVAECVENLIETRVVDRNAVILGVGACMLSVLTIAFYSSTRQSRKPEPPSTRKKNGNTGAKEEKRKSLDKKVMVDKISTLNHDYQSANGAKDCNSVCTTITVVPPSFGKRPVGQPDRDLVPVE